MKRNSEIALHPQALKKGEINGHSWDQATTTTFTSLNVETVRFGVLVENNSDMDIIANFEADNVALNGMSIVVLHRKSKIAAHVRHDGYIQPVTIRKNQLADDVSEVIQKDDLSKIGTINVKVQSKKRPNSSGIATKTWLKRSS